MTGTKPTAFSHVLAATEEQLIIADAAWVTELALAFGAHAIDEVASLPTGRGEEGSTLRHSYDARQQALAKWRKARGLD